MTGRYKIFLALTTMATFQLTNFLQPLHAETPSASDSSKQNAEDEKAIGGNSGEKGGIYVAGRAFKTAGSEMADGFNAAGRGIKKGGQATGKAFNKAGGSIKNFFTGEKN